MTDSILQTIKSMLGLDVDCDDFDIDVITNINSALFSLNQLGVGPENPYVITGEEQTWTDFLGETTDFDACKMFVYFKTRLGFDPPGNSFVLQSMEKQINELEWRLNIQAEGRNQNESGYLPRSLRCQGYEVGSKEEKNSFE